VQSRTAVRLPAADGKGGQHRMDPIHNFPHQETRMRRNSIGIVVLTAALASTPASAQDRAAVIANALQAAPASIAEAAAVMDWEGNTLREGTNGWVCFPDPPNMQAAPMCLDETWLAWADAWQKKQPVTIDRPGIAYMLLGDAGASNVDPFAEGPTADNEWVVTGPHLMLIVPDPASLAEFSTDPENGGPWVMWSGTPYAHVMIPVAAKQ
jgi:hypothetical protein